MNAITTTKLWDDFSDGVWRFARARLASDADADDVTQEVFLKVHRRQDQLRDDERVAGWLFRIASNAVVDHHRSVSRRAESQIVEPIPVTPDDPRAEERLLAACVRPFIEQLSEPYRTALVWVEIDGMTQVEAAERAGLSVSGMKSRVQRGRAKLREALEECCAIELDTRNGIRDVTPRCAGDC